MTVWDQITFRLENEQGDYVVDITKHPHVEKAFSIIADKWEWDSNLDRSIQTAESKFTWIPKKKLRKVKGWMPYIYLSTPTLTEEEIETIVKPCLNKLNIEELYK